MSNGMTITNTNINNDTEIGAGQKYHKTF